MLSIANDNVVGGSGTNLIMGGGLFLTVPFNAADPTQWVDLGGINLAAESLQLNRRACLSYALNGQKVTKSLANDNVDVSNGTYNIVFGGGGKNPVIPGLGFNSIWKTSGTTPDRKTAIMMQQFVLSSFSPTINIHWLNLADTAGLQSANGLFYYLSV